MAELLYEGHDLDVLSDMPNYYNWIMASFSPHIRGEVIEYGAGSGTVSARLEPLAEKLTLVEPSPNLAGVLRSRFAGNGKVAVVSALIEQHTADIASDSIDAIVMVNVLEHVEDDVAALGELMRILKPGGHLLLFVPALQALMSKIDLMHGHFRRYHRPDLQGKVVAAGGEVLDCRYFDAFGVVPWFLLNKMLGSTSFNPKLVALNDRVVVPLSRAAEGVVTPPFGKNLILVARKPSGR
ncbi:MAG: class I SAM-dependent methyltransferase [Beijerinckiaceae bacterium]|nr:class I SAM-dependent methyltransferase [Beijerinckiaceae bacterium]